jgi:hypothetical protein
MLGRGSMVRTARLCPAYRLCVVMPAPALRPRGPIDQRSHLGRRIVNLHLQHLILILQGHAGLFGGFDRIVVRLEMTVDYQRVTLGRGFIGANDFTRLLFFDFDLRLLHADSRRLGRD